MVEDKKTGIPAYIDNGYDPSAITAEWIEQLINSKIHPRIDGVRIKAVQLDSKGQGRVGYVVHVPQSMRAPHQASDKKYYKRYNRQIMAMEDYEIRDVMRRAQSPELGIEATIELPSINRDIRMGKFDRNIGLDGTLVELPVWCSAHLTVKGGSSAKEVYITIDSTPQMHTIHHHLGGNWQHIDFSPRGGSGFNAIAARRTLHPDQRYKIFENVEPYSAIRLLRTIDGLLIKQSEIKMTFFVHSTDQIKSVFDVDFSDSTFPLNEQAIINKIGEQPIAEY
jgi:hypothetical protein